MKDLWDIADKYYFCGSCWGYTPHAGHAVGDGCECGDGVLRELHAGWLDDDDLRIVDLIQERGLETYYD